MEVQPGHHLTMVGPKYCRESTFCAGIFEWLIIIFTRWWFAMWSKIGDFLYRDFPRSPILKRLGDPTHRPRAHPEFAIPDALQDPGKVIPKGLPFFGTQDELRTCHRTRDIHLENNSISCSGRPSFFALWRCLELPRQALIVSKNIFRWHL